jgi:hypothetical protein
LKNKVIRVIFGKGLVLEKRSVWEGGTLPVKF